MPAKTSPQDRSNLARKAAQARWSRITSSPILPNGAGECEGPNITQKVSLPPSPDSSTPASTQKNPKSKIKRPKSHHHSWLDERFCLHLYQNSASEWRLRTPSGIDLPATNAEISLWLDIESLRFQLSNYDDMITG